MTVEWATKNGLPYEFMDDKLTMIDDIGVYIIWLGPDGPIVYVGQGKIEDRLQEHREDSRFSQYDRWNMYVTWASVSSSNRDGVERFLADHFDPVIGERWKEADPIRVNLPFGQR